MGRMAADKVDFHEMGLDDRLLKVDLSFVRHYICLDSACYVLLV